MSPRRVRSLRFALKKVCPLLPAREKQCATKSRVRLSRSFTRPATNAAHHRPTAAVDGPGPFVQGSPYAMALCAKNHEHNCTACLLAAGARCRKRTTSSDMAEPEPRQESTSAPTPRLPPGGSHWRAAGCFVYSIVLTALSVYNALATESFSWASGSSMVDKNVVFGISAVLEASGMAFGMSMSMLWHLKGNEGGLSGDLLAEPYIMALEGMFGEGARGETLFLTGLVGAICQGIIACVTYLAVPIRREGKGFEAIVLGGVSLAGVLFVVFVIAKLNTGNDGKYFGVFASASFLFFALLYEASEAYYLIVSGASVVTCALVVMDALAIVPLGVAGVGIFLVLMSREVHTCTSCCCCPPSCGEVLNLQPYVACIVRRLERINFFVPQQSGEGPAFTRH